MQQDQHLCRKIFYQHGKKPLTDRILVLTTLKSTNLKPELKKVTLNGRKIAYQTYGTVGPVVLLVHGMGASLESWKDIAPQLANHNLQVVTIDLPGHGQSCKEAKDYNLAISATVIKDLLDHLGYSKVTFVGHSLGGGIALQFLGQYSEYLTGLILVSAGGLGKETGKWLRALALPGSGVLMAGFANVYVLNSLIYIGKCLQKMGVTVSAISEETLNGISAVFTAKNSRQAFLATLRDVINVKGQKKSALNHLLHAKTLPVTIIWGKEDSMIPVHHGYTAAQLLPHAKLAVFDASGHDPHYDDPEQFVKLIVEQLGDKP